MFFEQDKNRDVIVAFPDVDPAYILISKTSTIGKHHGSNENLLRRASLNEISNSFDRPHLWYSTSKAIHALELFLASRSQLSESNTFR